MADQRNIIIVGSGLAGYSLLREYRKLDAESNVTVVCADSGDFYSKPMLSNALATQKTPPMLVNQSAADMVKSLNFELVQNVQLTAIDTAARTVSSSTGSWQYQKLVLAVGARPVVLPLGGDAGNSIVSVNHLDDYRHFRERLSCARHVAIVGPGLIGCEFANDLLSANKRVSVIGPDPWPISNLLPESAGRFLHSRLERAGVEFYLQRGVEAVDHSISGYRLQLNDERQLDADLVLSATGLHAELSLANSAGLATNRAIITNRSLQTSAEHVYALGDCAEVDGYHLPFVMPIMHGARALARTLSGAPTPVQYPAMPVVIKTPACPLVVARPPVGDTPVEWTREESGEGVKALAYRDGEMVGFALAGDRVGEKQQLTRSMPTLF